MDFTKGEQFSEEFIKKNPQHTVPLLEDDGEIIYDSHAIAEYLVEKYAPDDKLYPKDLIKRAHVNQRLHFDSGILFTRLRAVFEPILFRNELVFPEEKRVAILKAYDFLEAFLKNDKYLVGDSLTIADLCAIPSVTTLGFLVKIDEEKYPKLCAWIKRLESLPYYALNKEGNDDLEKAYKTKMGL